MLMTTHRPVATALILAAVGLAGSRSLAQATPNAIAQFHSPLGDGTAGLFSSEDYPPEAFKNGWEGDVGVKMRVGIDGKPHSCRILHSSGYPVLDVQTCALVLGRARFLPARDAKGQPVEADLILPTVRWAIDGSTRPHLAADVAPIEPSWKRIGSGASGDAYLDFNSLGQQGTYRIAWVKTVFAEPKSNGTAYDVGQFRFDCVNRTSTLLRGEGFQKDGTPLLVVQFPEAGQKTLAVAPGNAMEGILKRVCQ